MGRFLAWCEARGLALEAVSPLHVAAYIRMHPGSAPTVKQHLAAIRMLGDWLVVSQVFMVNPAAAVRGPKHVVTKGATPVLSLAEARRLLELGWIEAAVRQRAWRLRRAAPARGCGPARPVRAGERPTRRGTPSGRHLPFGQPGLTACGVSQVLPVNPAPAVRGPKHVVTKGARRPRPAGSSRRSTQPRSRAGATGRWSR